MDWFSQLRLVLSDYYLPDGPPDVVGYLQGNGWRTMRTGQMLVLGTVAPINEEWIAAGVGGRNAIQAIGLNDLGAFVVTFVGFPLQRPWGQITLFSPDIDYSITLGQFQRALRKRSEGASRRTKVIAAMRDALDNLRKQYERNSGEHRAEADIMTGLRGDSTGFWGYWTNQLCNKDVPPQTISNQCFAEMEHARRMLRAQKLGESAKAIASAQSELLKATGIYYRWKDRIEGVSTKMQLAICAVAVALIVAAAAATAAGGGAAAATGASAAEGTSATASVTELSSLLSKADIILVRVVTTAPGGTTAAAMVDYKQPLKEVAKATETLLKVREN